MWLRGILPSGFTDVDIALVLGAAFHPRRLLLVFELVRVSVKSHTSYFHSFCCRARGGSCGCWASYKPPRPTLMRRSGHPTLPYLRQCFCDPTDNLIAEYIYSNNIEWTSNTYYGYASGGKHTSSAKLRGVGCDTVQ